MTHRDTFRPSPGSPVPRFSVGVESVWGCGGTGIRTRFRFWRPQGCVGSTPISPTTQAPSSSPPPILSSLAADGTAASRIAPHRPGEPTAPPATMAYTAPLLALSTLSDFPTAAFVAATWVRTLLTDSKRECPKFPRKPAPPAHYISNAPHGLQRDTVPNGAKLPTESRCDELSFFRCEHCTTLFLSCLFAFQAFAAGPFGFEYGMTKGTIMKRFIILSFMTLLAVETAFAQKEIV